MTHTELCNTFMGNACDCGIVTDAVRRVEQEISEALEVMDAAVDPCFDALFEALKAIQKAKQ